MGIPHDPTIITLLFPVTGTHRVTMNNSGQMPQIM